MFISEHCDYLVNTMVGNARNPLENVVVHSLNSFGGVANGQFYSI